MKNVLNYCFRANTSVLNLNFTSVLNSLYISRKLSLAFLAFMLIGLNSAQLHSQDGPCGMGVGTIIFDEDFEDEADGDVSGTDANGVTWTATCTNCAAGDIFEVDTANGNAQGCNGTNGLRGNDTNGPAVFSVSNLDVSSCDVIYFDFSYCATGYMGSGNLECFDECSGCSGIPAEGVSNGGCNNCWDFLYGEIDWGSGSSQVVLLGDDCNVPASGTTGSPVCSSTDINGNVIPTSDLTSVDLNIVMAMWAGVENMKIDNIVMICYSDTDVAACSDPSISSACASPPIVCPNIGALSVPADICVGEDFDLTVTGLDDMAIGTVNELPDAPVVEDIEVCEGGETEIMVVDTGGGGATSDLPYIADFTSASYTSTTDTDNFPANMSDYFGVTDGSDIDQTFLGADRDFYAAQDTDAAGDTDDSISLQFDGISIDGCTDLMFSIDVAEGDDGSAQDWDDNTEMIVEVDIDNSGVYTQVFGVQAMGGTNSEPAVDTNFDGIGDGAAITDVFTTYTSPISGTGTTINIKITLNILDSGDEDIAFDNVSVTGTCVTPPTATYNFYAVDPATDDTAVPVSTGGSAYDPMTTPADSPESFYVTCVDSSTGCESTAAEVVVIVNALPTAEAGPAVMERAQH